MEKLIGACIDHKKLLQICDEKEKNLKDITTLRTQLEDSKRHEEVVCIKQKEKKDYVDALENVVDTLGRQLEEKDQQIKRVKSNIAVNKSRSNLQRGDASSDVENITE